MKELIPHVNVPFKVRTGRFYNKAQELLCLPLVIETCPVLGEGFEEVTLAIWDQSRNLMYVVELGADAYGSLHCKDILKAYDAGRTHPQREVADALEAANWGNARYYLV